MIAATPLGGAAIAAFDELARFITAAGRALLPRSSTRIIRPRKGPVMQVLAFSNKHPDTVRPIGVDFSDLMDDATAPALTGGAVTIAPADTLTAAAPTWSGQVLSFVVAGGTDGTTYTLTVTGAAAGGWTEVVTASLYVTSSAPPAPAPLPA
jgi:hypothetical protein